MKENSTSTFELLIRPRRGWQPVDLREIWLYRELLGFLVWRDIKIRYKQTILGGLWAVLQPLIAMIIFTLLFNRAVGIQSKGAPYPLFAFVGLLPWTLFSNGLSASSNSLVGSQQLVSKIYFPRIFIPMGAIFALLVDTLVSLLLMGGLMVYYRWAPSWRLILIPAFTFECLLITSGLGIILSALNVQFRDIKYAVPFLIQMGLFVTPIIYPVSYIPLRYRFLLGLNPLTGVVEGFRFCVLGGSPSAGLIGASMIACVVVFLASLFIFRRMERLFADVI
jgi:homopolymeric O-antigen transport system permease protein